MTDLLTKVKWALRAHKENFALDEDLEHLSLDMAQALIAETERREKVEAENAVLREMQGLPPLGTYPEGELKRRMEANRAAMESRALARAIEVVGIWGSEEYEKHGIVDGSREHVIYTLARLDAMESLQQMKKDKT